MSLSEEELAAVERSRDGEAIPRLVAIIRQQQHDLDNLRLSLDVARRDREELRAALIQAREEARRRPPGQGSEPGPEGS